MKKKSKKKTRCSCSGFKNDKITGWATLTACVAILLFLLLYLNKFLSLNLSSDSKHWADFGSYFGGAAGPFVGFATIMLLVATLRQQRAALKEQQKMLTKTAENVDKQNKILFNQSFEQSFFGWLRDYKDQTRYLTFTSYANTVPSCPTEEPQADLSGMKALKGMAEFLMSEPIYDSNSVNASIEELLIHNLKQSWSAIQETSGDSVRTAIRSLYGIIKWIDSHDELTSSEKRHYTGIIRAQLTDSELILLFMNGLTETGAKFVPYINKYALFDNLQPTLYPLIKKIQCTPNVTPYKPSAFDTDIARQVHDQANQKRH